MILMYHSYHLICLMSKYSRLKTSNMNSVVSSFIIQLANALNYVNRYKTAPFLIYINSRFEFLKGAGTDMVGNV